MLIIKILKYFNLKIIVHKFGVVLLHVFDGDQTLMEKHVLTNFKML